MTQEQKLALRLKQLLAEDGLHEFKVIVVDGEILFWAVRTEKLEGLPQNGDGGKLSQRKKEP